MEYFPNLPQAYFSDPGSWAGQMESEGWHGICASDHILIGTSSYPHVFVTAAAMACATSQITITSSFCNNLFRTPVEFAQAALSLQTISNGRFEAGLGAGWAKDEIISMGLDYPEFKEPTYGVYLVTRYRDILEVMGQTERFSNRHPTGPMHLPQLHEVPKDLRERMEATGLDPASEIGNNGCQNPWVRPPRAGR